MIEKLLENWLDSASERSYQPVFVQMLAAQGYRVIHSTRHAALEFGKDVLAIAPDGRGCAFQLKGHPGGKLGLREFQREIQPQLVQMASQAVVYPGFPKGGHRSFLVSSGYFEEEVQRAVDDLNRAGYRSRIELISRGDLIKWANDLGTSLWPSELTEVRTLLELFLANPKNPGPVEKLADLLRHVLIEGRGKRSLKKAELERRCASAALLAGIVSTSFLAARNHYAVVAAWTMFCVTTIGACARHRIALSGSILRSFRLGEEFIHEALMELWKEVKERKYLIEGNALADPEIFGWRQVVLTSLLTALSVRLAESMGKSASEGDSEADELRLWLQNKPRIDIWGEAAVAAILPWLVWLFREDPSQRPERNLATILRMVLRLNAANSKNSLPSPYYSFEEIVRSRLSLERGHRLSALSEETFAGASFSAMPLFHALVKAGLKQTCRDLWPEYSRLTHRAFRVSRNWEYCLYRSRGGEDVSHITPLSTSWANIRLEVHSVQGNEVPAELAKRPYLLGLWWLFAPHRMTPEAFRILSTGLHPAWGV